MYRGDGYDSYADSRHEPDVWGISPSVMTVLFRHSDELSIVSVGGRELLETCGHCRLAPLECRLNIKLLAFLRRVSHWPKRNIVGVSKRVLFQLNDYYNREISHKISRNNYAGLQGGLKNTRYCLGVIRNTWNN